MAVCTVGILYFAYLGANYTKKIWQKDELKRCLNIIYDEHHKIIIPIIKVLDIIYIEDENLTLIDKLNYYHKNLPFKDISLPIYEKSLDILSIIDNNETQEVISDFKKSFNNFIFHYNAFYFEIYNIKTIPYTKEDKEKLILQANNIFKNLQEYKISYNCLYEELKISLINSIYK